MQYWLMKSEPDAFSIDDLKKAKIEPWDGIRNYQARNFMRDQMRVGDQVFFYHSSCAEPGIVGIMRVASKPYPDHTAFDPDSSYFDAKSDPDNPRWMMVDVKFSRKLKNPLTLETMKQYPQLADMKLLQRGQRLSVMPVEPQHWDFIQNLIKK